MQLIQTWLSNGWSVALVILGLGLIVFLHELGHFLMAKKNKVRVEIFSLGFGQAIYKFRRGETEYRIAWLPLGGYVKMSGETLGDDRKGEPFELTSKTPWQRFQIFVAGAAMNLIIAFPIAILCYVVGKCEVPNEVGRPGLSEAAAGIQPGDVILEVDGRKIDSLEKLRIEMIRHPNGTMVPVKLRRGEQIIPVSVESKRSSFHETYPPNVSIVDPAPGKPLYEQGVREKDEIVSVNGQKVYAQMEADAKLKECAGTDAVLEIRRRALTPDEDEKPRKITIRIPKKTWYQIPKDDNVIEARAGGVMDNLPAAGLVEPGDLIVRIGDRPITSWPDMKSVIEKSGGVTLQMTVLRDGQEKSFKITPVKGEGEMGLIGLRPKITNVFADIKPDSYFARMGLQSGDKLVSIDGHPGDSTLTLEGLPKEKVPPVVGLKEEKERTLAIEVDRKGQRVKIGLKLEPKDEGDLAAAGFKTDDGFLVTAGALPFRRRPLAEAFKLGLSEPIDITVMTIDILKKVITGGESAKGFSGPIGIIHASYSFAQRAFGNFIWLLCLITVNLGIFNLLPIPILDGGHNVLLLIEVVRKWLGKPPPSEKFVAAFQYVGLAFILTLFVFVTFNDISRFVTRG